jgi:hypothetical protein
MGLHGFQGRRARLTTAGIGPHGSVLFPFYASGAGPLLRIVGRKHEQSFRDSGFVPTANYPRPVLVHDGATALVYFKAAARSPGAEEERVVAVCERCVCSKFG